MSPPMVLQLQNVKIGGSYRPMFSNQIITLDRARQIIAANHNAALALGYTSTLDANHDRVTYVQTSDPPNVEITQWFVPFGHRFTNPGLPITGQWLDPKASMPRPDPGMKAIVGPPQPIGAGCDVIAVYGQSNAGGSGEGRFEAQVPADLGGFGGVGGYCWNDTFKIFQPLADPLGGGNDGQGYDAGCWARLCAVAFGLVIPETGIGLNRLVVYSGALGGTLIEQWAHPSLYSDTSTTDVAFTIGSKTFQVSTGVPWKYPIGYVRRFASLFPGHNPSMAFMDGSVIAYNSTTGQLTVNIFAVNQPEAGQSNNWQINPQFPGSAYNAANTSIVSMVNHGLLPRRVVFVHGESASNSPASWANAAILAQYWGAGAVSFNGMIGDAVFVASGSKWRPLIYVGSTTICTLHTGASTPDQIDAVAARTPDSYVANAKGQERIRIVQKQLGNTATGATEHKTRTGADLDIYGPDCRPDGCHVGNRGLDLQAEQWASIFYPQ